MTEQELADYIRFFAQGLMILGAILFSVGMGFSLPACVGLTFFVAGLSFPLAWRQ